MKKILIYFSLIVFAIGGCKKVDLDEVPSGDPVFTVNAELDGTDLNLVAGDDDFYMFSEYSKDNFDVISMTGRFAKDSNCINECDESLSFTIRNSFVDSLPNTPFDINSALIQGTNLNYFSNNNSTIVDGHIYTFSGDLLDTLGFAIAGDINWEIYAGQIFTTGMGNTISFPFYGTEDLEVRLSIDIENGVGCTSYFKTKVKNGLGEFCELDLDAEFMMGDSIYTLSLMGQNYDSIVWNGNTISTLTIPIFGPPSSIITLEAFNSNTNCSAELGICLNADSFNLSSIAFPKFNVQVQEDTMVINGNGEQLSAVTIEYQDSTGFYSSKFADNFNNTFAITKVEDYEINENGEKTKKLTIEYDCILKEGSSGEEKQISGTAEIAVAYPD